jgi:riboflavin kinase / FMN adenylyltransferase
VAESALAGVASLGVRPTITAGGRPVLEVHLFDFTGDLYSRHVRCEFLYKLRDEAKYPDLATLQRQIEIDVENARRFFNI